MEKLIKKRLKEDTHLYYYVSIDDTFDIIERAHISTGHGGRDRMVKELSKQYVNVICEAVELFKPLCVDCQWKHKRPTTKDYIKGIKSNVNGKDVVNGTVWFYRRKEGNVLFNDTLNTTIWRRTYGKGPLR